MAGPLSLDPHSWSHSNRNACLEIARILGRSGGETQAIADILFSVWEGVHRFEELELEDVEPAGTFSAAWGPGGR